MNRKELAERHRVENGEKFRLKDVDPFDFIRTLAVARILMPKSHVRLSAGREQMNEQMQSLAFLAGANSIFYGEKLLTTGKAALFSFDIPEMQAAARAYEKGWGSTPIFTRGGEGDSERVASGREDVAAATRDRCPDHRIVEP